MQEVANPLEHIQKQFQKIFKNNAATFYDDNTNYAKLFKLPNGNNVSNKLEFMELTKIEDFWKQLNFVKVE